MYINIYTIIQHVSGKPQMSDWYPPPQQQYLDLTSGGRNKSTLTQGSASLLDNRVRQIVVMVKS